MLALPIYLEKPGCRSEPCRLHPLNSGSGAMDGDEEGTKIDFRFWQILLQKPFWGGE
jgi:hypothetical protein